jgi:hypothetical protein
VTVCRREKSPAPAVFAAGPRGDIRPIDGLTEVNSLSRRASHPLDRAHRDIMGFDGLSYVIRFAKARD